MAWRAFPISCPKTGETGEFLFPPFRWTGDGWLIDEPYGTQSVDRLPINAINLNISSSSIPDTRSSLKIPFSMFFFSYPKVRTVLSKRASSLILFNVRSKTSKVRRLSMSAPARNNCKHFFFGRFFSYTARPRRRTLQVKWGDQQVVRISILEIEPCVSPASTCMGWQCWAAVIVSRTTKEPGEKSLFLFFSPPNKFRWALLVIFFGQAKAVDSTNFWFYWIWRTFFILDSVLLVRNMRSWHYF